MNDGHVTTLSDLFTRERLPSLIGALLLLGASYIIEHFANLYAFDFALRPTTNHVGDLILDNIPVIDLNFLIIEGAFLVIMVGTLYVFSQPSSVLFSLKALALFIIVRSFFISLTHIGIHPEHIQPGLGFFDGIYTYLNFQTGLFFSGHTGLPFLFALIFWHHHRARYMLLAVSATFGIAVLLAHIHYSIDVFAAPFVVFGIYQLARTLFPLDYALLRGSYFPRP